MDPSLKKIPLRGKYGKGQFFICDDEDFDFLKQFHWYVHRIVSGRNVSYQIVCLVKPVELIRGMLKSGLVYDHRDGNFLNNSKGNLRVATIAQNGANKRKQRTHNGQVTTSQYKGVYRVGKKWHVQVRGKHVGTFIHETDAARAYNDAAAQTFGAFARLNIIRKDTL